MFDDNGVLGRRLGDFVEGIPAYAPSVDVAALVQTNGVNCSGSYVRYTSASSDALLNPSSASQGTFTALILTVSRSGSGCTETLELKFKTGASVNAPSWSSSGVEHYNNGFYLQVVSRNGMFHVYNWGRHLAAVVRVQVGGSVWSPPPSQSRQKRKRERKGHKPY